MFLGEGPLKAPRIVSTGVKGFMAAATSCGLKPAEDKDLAVIAARRPVAAAGVFTTNRLAAAPVLLCRQRLLEGEGLLRAVVINSGCANAATGSAGMAAAEKVCEAAAGLLGCTPREVAPCSTGVIGVVLDDEKVVGALPRLLRALSPQGLEEAAKAIMTTDAFPKMAEARAGAHVVVGIAKGAGMIEPHMATMLAFLLTDAPLTPSELKAMLTEAVEASFNRISVDGQTSTNDTVIAMASGETEAPVDRQGLAKGFNRVCQELAAMIVADGEGAGHLVGVEVDGAASEAEARAFAYAIARSALVKTAIAGGDPNWGRIVSAMGAAAGRRGLEFNPERVDVWIGGHKVVEAGLGLGPEAEERAAEAMKAPRYAIRVELGIGNGRWWVLTSDLTHEYVSINADYRS